MLPHDSASRIWLDESAMNTFANAKNGTLNTSGRKKWVNYYKAVTNYPGEAFWGNDPVTNSDSDASGFGLGIGSLNLFDLDRDL